MNLHDGAAYEVVMRVPRKGDRFLAQRITGEFTVAKATNDYYSQLRPVVIREMENPCN